MSDPKRYAWIFVFCLGAGIVLMIALLKMDSSVPEEQALPILEEEPRERVATEPVQPRVRPQQPVVPTPIIVSQPDRHEKTATAALAGSKSTDGVSAEDQIYKMDMLPQDKSGIYWVRDEEGNVNQIAVDVPGENSPMGL